MFNAGDILNDTYEIIGPIGKGGLGTIYKARHLRLCKEVVIKHLETNVKKDFNSRGEADILKKLRHTYLPQVFDYVQVENVIYTVLDYIPGRDLQSYLDEGHSFTANELYKWFYQICEALQYLHSQNPPIIHSDIKPANIMIKPDGDICLIDFNVSLEEDREALKGISKTYASPEQYNYAMAVLAGEEPSDYKVDVRTDIYSLGATFYHLMTYIEPNCQIENMSPITDYELPYPESFVEIIGKTMAEKPGRRYKSTSQLLKVLERINKQDKRVKHIKRVKYITNIILTVFLIIGFLVTYWGYCMLSLEQFTEVYKKYLVSVEEAETPQDIISITEEMLTHYDTKMSVNREPDKYYKLYLNMANAYRDMDNLEQAEEYYKQLLIYEKADIYKEYALFHLKTAEYTESSAAINKAVRLGLNSGEAYYIKGLIAEAKGEFQDAILQYKKAIALLENDIYKLDAEERLSLLKGGS